MGTNFYWIAKPDGEGGTVAPTGARGGPGCNGHDDPNFHLGKMSAAGPYCWDCGVTLCVQGPHAVHDSERTYHEVCPRCGKTRTTHVCCSFTWAHDPEVAKRLCRERPYEKFIEDSRGQEYTGDEFLKTLRDKCPIEFDHRVGELFV